MTHRAPVPRLGAAVLPLLLLLVLPQASSSTQDRVRLRVEGAWPRAGAEGGPWGRARRRARRRASLMYTGYIYKKNSSAPCPRSSEARS